MGTRIMIVEDERIVARVLQDQLEQQGYEVVANVSTEDDAVASARRSRPDLVLMDINLGTGGDGIDAAARMRGSADVPVVFLSAYTDSATLARATAELPFGFLVKPVRDRELRPMIEVAVSRHRAEAGGYLARGPLDSPNSPFASLRALCKSCGRLLAEDGTWRHLLEFLEDEKSHGQWLRTCSACQRGAADG